METSAYELTKINRIYADDLERAGRFDIRQWPPLFVLGALQLPGTLAYVLQPDGYPGSGLSMCKSMVPGLRIEDGKSGTVVLGRGTHNFRRLKDWFGEGYTCGQTMVEIELADGAMRKLVALHWVEGKVHGKGVMKVGSVHGMKDSEQGKEMVAQTPLTSGVDQLGDGSGHGGDSQGDAKSSDVKW